MSSYNLSINEKLKAIACHPSSRREWLAAVVKENLMEIPVVIIPHHAPATNFSKTIIKTTGHTEKKPRLGLNLQPFGQPQFLEASRLPAAR
jgi:hypothetical protein